MSELVVSSITAMVSFRNYIGLFFGQYIALLLCVHCMAPVCRHYMGVITWALFIGIIKELYDTVIRDILWPVLLNITVYFSFSYNFSIILIPLVLTIKVILLKVHTTILDLKYNMDIRYDSHLCGQSAVLGVQCPSSPHGGLLELSVTAPLAGDCTSRRAPPL